MDGQSLVIGGTSAVAPLWAGLIAIANHQLGRSVGYLNPVLYGLPSNVGAFRDITTGDNDVDAPNGPYRAQSGWDACTGLGSPNGQALIDALAQNAQHPVQPNH
ncbi:hypothetical protein GCM10025857_17530 [Alicyclobacillus contaminans]|nr:hypothetical protein GCM10025857_17530 [Alicyclobacillus contaminans]